MSSNEGDVCVLLTFKHAERMCYFANLHKHSCCMSYAGQGQGCASSTGVYATSHIQAKETRRAAGIWSQSHECTRKYQALGNCCQWPRAGITCQSWSRQPETIVWVKQVPQCSELSNIRLVLASMAFGAQPVRKNRAEHPLVKTRTSCSVQTAKPSVKTCMCPCNA